MAYGERGKIRKIPFSEEDGIGIWFSGRNSDPCKYVGAHCPSNMSNYHAPLISGIVPFFKSS
jgi:hypothetical protein